MIEPDQPPEQDKSAGPPAKHEREQDLDFLQRCFRETLSGEFENWPVETFRLYFAAMKRFAEQVGIDGLMPAPKLTYGERFATAAIVELSKKISASWKGRHMLDKLLTVVSNIRMSLSGRL